MYRNVFLLLFLICDIFDNIDGYCDVVFVSSASI